MTNVQKPTSHDSERKNQKDAPNKKDSKVNDSRNIARQEHTNHFTNRATDKK